MSDTNHGLLERLGGPTTLASVIDEVYKRALSDDELSPFFAHANLEKLLRMQYEFLIAAFDGPVQYSGAELTAVHAGRGIKAAHFAKFCGHFADVLEARGISSQDLNLVLARLSMYKDKITGSSNVAG